MSNDLTTTQGGGYLALSDDDFLSRLTHEAENMRGGGNSLFMKMDGNTGTFSYGQDETELAPGTQLVMNYRTYKRGWIIWVGGEVAYETMVGIEEGDKPAKTSLPDHGPYGKDDGPREQHTVEFKLLEEPFAELLFQANNKSKINALGALLKDFVRSVKNHPGCYPIIELDSNSFEAKDPENPKRKFKKFAPVFKIVDWMSADELNAMAEGSPEDYEADENAEEAEAVVEETPAPQPAQQTRPAPASRPAPRPAAAAPAQKAAAAAPAAQPAAGTRRGRF